MDYAFSNLTINSKKIYKYYLILININTKFLFATPIRNNITPTVDLTRIVINSINDHLATLSPNLKINNIRADGDSKFGRMIEDNDTPDKIKLDVMTYKRNSFFDYLASEGITLFILDRSF
jgi:hypothetical protein